MGTIKRIIKVGQFTSATGGTLLFSSVIDESICNREVFMDVLINQTALTGTSPTMTYSVQENFSDHYFTTATSSAIAATGETSLTHEEGSVSGGANGAHPLLGKGIQKKIVATAGGTVATASADVYAVFFGKE